MHFLNIVLIVRVLVSPLLHNSLRFAQEPLLGTVFVFERIKLVDLTTSLGQLRAQFLNMFGYEHVQAGFSEHERNLPGYRKHGSRLERPRLRIV